jgi:hypothetical protein
MSESAPISQSAQRNLDLIRHRDDTLARWPADDPAVAEWLAQFRDDAAGRTQFLKRYADERASALVYGKDYWEMARREEAKLVKEATERLWEIQQRKLFEVQVRWRAEEITLPAEHVELCDDFEWWDLCIEACPLVPPIAPAEVEAYLAYLLSDACTDAACSLARPLGWQDYERYRRYLLLQAEGQDPEQVKRDAAYQKPEGLGGLAALLDDFLLEYPGWYAHCDALAGPPNLVRYLPDHRGSKEEYYCYLGRTGRLPDPYADDAASDEENQTPSPVAAAPAPLRTLDFQEFPALADTLVRQFESAELLRFHEAILHEPASVPVRPPGIDDDEFDEDEEDDDDETQAQLDEQGLTAGRDLCAIPERLPVAAHPDWREALQITWVNWRKRRLAQALREAYAAYQTRQAAGQPHPSPYPKNKPKREKSRRKNRELVKDLILKGRAVAGEPQDLNF